MSTAPELSRVFRALSSPHRLAIFREIIARQRAGEAVASGQLSSGCVLTDFIKRLGIRAPTVSHHLHELADAGLIRVDREGRQLRCSVCEEVPEALLVLLRE